MGKPIAVKIVTEPQLCTETNLKSVHRLLIKLHTRVVMNSTIGSTLGPRALDVGSLNYFEAFEIS